MMNIAYGKAFHPHKGTQKGIYFDHLLWRTEKFSMNPASED